jgi:23S rRNA (guanosine2251-2'-O)-methyltransferase
MYLYGKNSVLERLKVDSGSIREICIQDNFRTQSIVDTIKESNIPLKRVTEKELLRIKRADRLQGIVAKVNKFAYRPYEKILGKPERDQLSFLFLDGINDPHNLGSIMRIAACFGGFALVIPRHSSCEVNETVIHVASGGENYVPVCQVTNLTTALREAKKAGYWAVGTVIEGGEDVNTVSLPFLSVFYWAPRARGSARAYKTSWI